MKERIIWIDYVKAFAIFFVVFSHVEVFSMNHYGGFFQRLHIPFSMPLFFFLSGMFAKPYETISEVCQSLKKKSVHLLLPFLVCGSIYTFLCRPDLELATLFFPMKGESHNGYWFLLVLFEIFFIFHICQLFAYKIPSRWISHDLSFSLLSLLIWIIMVVFSILGVIHESWCSAFSYHKIHYYFPHFVCGYLLMRHRNSIHKLFSQKNYSIALIIFISLFILKDRYEVKILPLKYMLDICAIIITCYLFIKISKYNMVILDKVLKYVGKYTLDIFLLHYFLIPNELSWLNTLVGDGNLKDENILIELIGCSTISIIVITACIFLSKILRESPIVRKLVFGA